jgi:hypothetical protein
MKPGFFRDTRTKNIRDKVNSRRTDRNGPGFECFEMKYAPGEMKKIRPGIRIRKNVTRARLPSGLIAGYPVIIRPSK